jgi:hypothetical protein
MRTRARGVSLVEVLVATLVMAGLGVSIYDTMISTSRGIQVDRVAEAKRYLTLDLLERFCHPYSDLGYLYPKGTPSPAVKQITIEDAMTLVGVATEDRAQLKQTLETGSVTGFTLVWHRGLAQGLGTSNVLRKDRLWVHCVTSKQLPGPKTDTFRVFTVRDAGAP